MSLPQPFSQPSDRSISNATNITPVLVVKQLVANLLHQQQDTIQDILISLGFALRSFNNLNQFLSLIPYMASRLTDTDGSALVLYKPNGQFKLEQIYLADSKQEKQIRQAIETALRVVPTSLNNSNLNTAALVSSKAAALDAIVSRYLAPYLGSDIHLFGTDILARKKELGLGRLYVFSCNPEYSWTESKQKSVRFVADQTAVALENDELTVELRKKDRLDRELEIGAEIQRQLLPRQCPQIPGVSLAALCKQANRVGGDYYDFIPTNQYPGRFDPEKRKEVGNTWALVIGDVMGKGVPAGLLMTMTRGMLRGEVFNNHSPAQVLEKLNQVMYADLENSHRFVTLFYSEYDPQTRMLSYSNAAHNPPLLWRAQTSEVKRLDTSGVLIGLNEHSQYEDAQVQLKSGDTVIYYTDGFTDAANPSGERFDEERLIQALCWACKHYQEPQAILEYLFTQVQQFIGTANNNNDDMTLVVLKVD